MTDMPELKSCPDEFRAAMTRVIAIAKAYRADESDGGNYKGANESNRKAIEYAETLLNTRPTPPADAMEIFRDETGPEDMVGKNGAALQSPAPVTDAQREAGADLEGAIEHFDHLDLLFMRIAKAHKEGKPSGVNILSAFREFCESQSWQTIRAALSAPVAQGTVTVKFRNVDLLEIPDEEEKTIVITGEIVHLTPKTQSEE